MSWRKYFTPVPVGKDPGSYSPVGSNNSMSSRPGPARANYSSFLPEVYTGAPNRIERYLQYSTMDMDSEIAAALDILAEFCSQKNKENKTPFYLTFRSKATNTEISILREYLQQWSKLQQFETRMFRIIRNVFKNGDCFFVRDPETQKWQYIDPAKLVKIIVNESDGKMPEQYVIRDLSPNFQHLVVTAINPGTTNTNNRGTSYVAGGAAARGMIGAYPANPSSSGSRFTMGQDEVAVEARHIVHLSLSEGLDNNYPFGNSILENIFKVYKQKELLEDAIIIYRITRAPERRIFYIDVGNMPSHLAMSFVERVKNEINQRRIPSPVGGAGSYSIDSAFNPMCLDLSTHIPLLDGRTLTLSEIIEEYKEGKENWVYSCNPETGAAVPGNITWAGITRENAETVKITLDNGKDLICTPDHKIPVFGKGFVEAKDLTADDSLIAFDMIEHGDTYRQIWDHSSKQWVYAHKMIRHFFEIKLTGTSRTIFNDDALYFDYSQSIRVQHISNIEKYENMTVGTITVDGEERWHDYHTFAISSGIYVKNSTNEDFYFPQSADGKGSKVDTLPGGANVGEIADLQFFTNKLFRGLKIPSSYLPTGAEDSGQQYNDGRVGTAYIQELRFNNYCIRLQSLVEGTFDKEFKLYLYNRGVNIDTSLFDLKLQDPQNFATYRQAEMDGQRIPTFTQMVAVPIISKRFALKRFLGLSDEELAENERLWAEENGHSTPIGTDSVSEMRGLGISQAGIQSDASMAATPEMPPEGAEAMPGTTPESAAQPMVGAESQG